MVFEYYDGNRFDSIVIRLWLLHFVEIIAANDSILWMLEFKMCRFFFWMFNFKLVIFQKLTAIGTKNNTFWIIFRKITSFFDVGFFLKFHFRFRLWRFHFNRFIYLTKMTSLWRHDDVITIFGKRTLMAKFSIQQTNGIDMIPLGKVFKFMLIRWQSQPIREQQQFENQT